MEKVVVTGGAGFIGSHLVNALIKAGFEVFIIDNLSSGKKENLNSEAKFFNLDIRNLEDIKPVVQGAKYVFHLAAIPSVQYSIENPKETHEINVAGTLNVLLSAKEAKVKRVILSSSCAIYGDVNKLPTDENCEIKPKSPYALHKYIGEQYCKLFIQLYGVETVCLRYFNVYGKGQSSTGAYASVIAKFLDLRKQNKKLTIVGDGNQTRDFINVADVAQANILAAKSERVGKGESINIGSGKKYSVKEIAKIIGGEIEFLPPRIEIKDSLADITLAKFLLNWEPKVDFEEGIKELL